MLRTRPKISVIIPAFNEAKRLGQTLQDIAAYFSSQSLAFEIIVVDDASRDLTAQVAARFQPGPGGTLRLLRNVRNRGKGGSVRRGLAAARGELCLFTDADLSTPIREFAHLSAALEARGCAVAIGSRAVPGASLLVPQPWYRTGMGKTFNFFVRLLVLPGLHDSQCGFKLFTRPAGRAIFKAQTLAGFGFDVEILYLAKILGYGTAEVPVAWSNSPASTVSPVKDASQMFFDLFRILWRHRRQKRK